MPIDIATLEESYRYINSCKKHCASPNAAILSVLFKAEVKRSCNELCSLEISLDHLMDVEFPPLIDLCMELDASEVEAVDISNESLHVLNGKYALLLMRAINQKLRVVDLQDLAFGKDFLSLMFLSLCETRILNLWTTIAALSKLPSLVELRFQHWSCCNDVGPYSASSSGNFHHKTYSNQRNNGRASSVNIGELTDLYSSTEEVLRNMFLLNNVVINDDESGLEDSDDSDLDFTINILVVGTP
ncbi:hypothetical protein ACLB2K_020827 [Fragaria x ananassa]